MHLLVRHRRCYDFVIHTQDIADEISENLEKLVGSEPEPDVKVAPAKPAQTRMDSATIKFDNLKFGKNYDPTKES